MRNLLGALLIALSLGGGLTACQAPTRDVEGVEVALTARQEALDILTAKYEPLQILIEWAVSDANTPAGVRKALQQADKAAVAALESYTEAVIAGQPRTKALLDGAFDAIQNVTVTLAANGLFGKGDA